jgi:hypothetical protein
LKKYFELGESTGDWTEFFTRCYEIANYTLVNKFSNISSFDKENIKQEMVVKIWQLIKENKINKESNMFSYILQRYIFMLRDVIRKSNRQKRIVEIISLSENMI